MGVAIIVVGALTFATIASLRNAQFSQNQAQATKLAQEGLEKVKSLKPDLILLDMILPGKSGFDILGELQTDAELKKIPVIVFSSLSQQSDIDEANKLGCSRYLPKDNYSPKQIVDEIKKIFLEK
jgi:DNA-binding NarL/FixJ family response regulator